MEEKGSDAGRNGGSFAGGEGAETPGRGVWVAHGWVAGGFWRWKGGRRRAGGFGRREGERWVPGGSGRREGGRWRTGGSWSWERGRRGTRDDGGERDEVHFEGVWLFY